MNENKLIQKSLHYESLCDELDHLITLYEIEPVFTHLIKCIIWYNKFTKSQQIYYE